MKLLKIKLLAEKRVVQETLNRMGIANKKKRELYPSCYIYEDDGEYPRERPRPAGRGRGARLSGQNCRQGRL